MALPHGAVCRFDVDGNHTAGRTPVHSQALALQQPLGMVAGADGHHTAASSPPADAHELREEVHALQDKVKLHRLRHL